MDVILLEVCVCVISGCCGCGFSLCLALSEVCCQRARHEVERQEILREESTLQENLRHVIAKLANQKQ